MVPIVLQSVKARPVHSRFQQTKKNCGAMGMPDMPLFKGRVTHTAANLTSHIGKSQLPYILNVYKASGVEDIV